MSSNYLLLLIKLHKHCCLPTPHCISRFHARSITSLSSLFQAEEQFDVIGSSGVVSIFCKLTGETRDQNTTCVGGRSLSVKAEWLSFCFSVNCISKCFQFDLWRSGICHAAGGRAGCWSRVKVALFMNLKHQQRREISEKQTVRARQRKKMLMMWTHSIAQSRLFSHWNMKSLFARHDPRWSQIEPSKMRH